MRLKATSTIVESPWPERLVLAASIAVDLTFGEILAGPVFAVRQADWREGFNCALFVSWPHPCQGLVASISCPPDWRVSIEHMFYAQ